MTDQAPDSHLLSDELAALAHETLHPNLDVGSPRLVELQGTVEGAGAVPVPVVTRNTIRDTWGWLWKDTLGRVVPFYVATGIFAWRTGRGVKGMGLHLRPEDLARDALVGLAAGIPLTLIAAEYRRRLIPAYRLPTAADQLLQSAFYLVLNAPAEELFFRAMLQPTAIAGFSRVGLPRRAAVAAGYALATAMYGSYHRLGGWSWRAIAGVTAAGLLFGALFQWRPGRSLWPSILAHAGATAGFLSWGDAYLHLWARRKGNC